MSDYWEKKKQGVLYYAQLTPDGVTVGDYHEEAGIDNGAACTHAEFLQGRYQDIIRQALGEATLAEIIAAVQARVANPPNPA